MQGVLTTTAKAVLESLLRLFIAKYAGNLARRKTREPRHQFD